MLKKQLEIKGRNQTFRMPFLFDLYLRVNK